MINTNLAAGSLPAPVYAGTPLLMRGSQMLRAFSLLEADTVHQLAEEYLRDAEHHRQCKDYGNAIHQANTVLGLIALEEERVEQAESYLEASALTPGSAQLSAFGPNMLLAQKLLERGRRGAVLRYLDHCGRFWKLSFGRLWLWKLKIRRGLRPDFGANLSYLLDYKSFG